MNYIKLLLITLAFHAMPLSADMILNKSIIYFEPGEANREDLEIHNPTSNPLYIKITPKIVRNPGTDTQAREIYDNPKEAGLLVSPNKLIVPPNSRKLLRIVNLQPGATNERVYRISVTPVAGELEANKSGVKILIGYEVLVIVHPAKGNYELTHEIAGNTLNITNQGTQNVLLRKGKQCPPDTEDENLCEHYQGKRLYPGNTWSVDLANSNPVTFFLSKGKEHSVHVFE